MSGIEAAGVGRQRLIPVSGAYNFRDIGGYHAASGVSRWGKVYRSDALSGLDEQGRAALVGLGIRRIIDLREPDEIAAAPSLIDGLDIVTEVAPIIDRSQWHEPPMGPDYLPAVYEHFVDACGTSIANAVRLIARSGDEPVLVHCTAGKDRTGIVVALALDAVGVGRDEIADDFAQTEQNLGGEWLEATRIKLRATRDEAALQAAEITLSSAPELILRALDRIERNHGSSTGFLLDHGLDSADLVLLAEVLLDAPALAPAR